MRRLVRDPTGRTWRLGRRLGQGGEGAVFELEGAPSLVGKLYHRAPTSRKAQKLRRMIAMSRPDLGSVACWPSHLLLDSRKNDVVGFVMPKVAGYREIHTLYSPAQRKGTFPRADWAFLIRTAVNCTVAFERVHDLGCVIGDVNQGNVLVGRDALVRLIDCDSFQVSDGSTVYRCNVGVAHFTPPELRGTSFQTVNRSVQHDLFGLALLIFHLLMMGRHPFAGRFKGSGDMPIERAIAEHRFAFGPSATQRQMEPPPFSLPLECTGSASSLFERAFANGSTRPGTSEWRDCLVSLERTLVSCSSFKGHRFLKDMSACPWCSLIRNGAPDFFITVSVTATGGTVDGASFDLRGIWAAIESCQPPEVRSAGAPTVPRIRRRSLRPAGTVWAHRCTVTARTLAKTGVLLLLCAIFWHALLGIAAMTFSAGVVLILIVGRFDGAYKMETARRKRVLDDAKRDWERLSEQLSGIWPDARKQFGARLRTLWHARNAHAKLTTSLQTALEDLERTREGSQRRQFLESHLIEAASLPGVGPDRNAALASFGIETAAEITDIAVRRVPGIGPKVARRLTEWRANKEKLFEFDPSQGVSDAEKREVAMRFQMTRGELECELRQGPASLSVLNRSTQARYDGLRNALKTAGAALAQATADAQGL